MSDSPSIRGQDSVLVSDQSSEACSSYPARSSVDRSEPDRLVASRVDDGMLERCLFAFEAFVVGSEKRPEVQQAMLDGVATRLGWTVVFSILAIPATMLIDWLPLPSIVQAVSWRLMIVAPVHVALCSLLFPPTPCLLPNAPDNRDRANDVVLKPDAAEVSGSSDSSSCFRNHVLDTEHDGESIVETTIRLVNMLLEDEGCEFQIQPSHLCGTTRDNGKVIISLWSVACEPAHPAPNGRVSRRVGDGLPSIVCSED